MQTIKSIEEFNEVTENKIIGRPSKMTDCIFEFFGKNNILFFDDNLTLNDTSIRFYGDNNIVFLNESGSHILRLKIDIYNNSTFYIGKECNTTRPLHIVLSEGKNVIIGNDCLFSLNIWFRNADPHLIYDSTSHQRINPSKSIYLGDHVWVGQDVLISKGTKIGSGSIVGAKSLTTSKPIPSNCSAGGSPARIIKNDIFWRKPSVHAYKKKETDSSNEFLKNTFIYRNDNKILSFEEIEKNLMYKIEVSERYNYIYENLYMNKNKNRFFIDGKTKFQKFMSLLKKIRKKYLGFVK